MDKGFYNRIEKGTAHRKSRDENTSFVLMHPEYLSDLAEIACNPQNKNHYKALWVMELMSIRQPTTLLPVIDSFCGALPSFKIEKAIRPCAKICYQLTKSKKLNLSENQEQKIIETCLDWLIKDVKVAPAAFAMRTLFLLGKKYPWINDELRLLLSRDLNNATPGYRFAVKDILKRLQ